MKVLFFINGLAAGGKERRLVELIKGLKAESLIEFELAIMSNDIHYKELFNLDIRIHTLIRKSKKDISIFKKLYSLCKQVKPDIIHCWDSMTAVYSAPICRLLNIKLANGMVVNSPEKRNLLNKEYRRAKITFPFSDIIIGNSEAGLSAYGVEKKKRICIHNGFNFERLENLESPEKLQYQLNIKTKYVVGMVASFSAFKDYKTFFEAAQMLLKTRNDVVFLAIGHNTDSSEAKMMIQEKNIEYFRLLGKRSDVEALIDLMNIGVLSTFTEGISNSILEYMALGKPVIATDGGGTNEIVANGLTGFLIQRSNPNELSDKINILLSNDYLRTKMGIAGKERIINQFSIHSMIHDYTVIYKRLYKN